MISIVKNKEKSRAFKNAVMGIDGIRQNPRGTVIEYHQGDWVDLIGNTKIGKQAWAYHELGLIVLCQKRIDGGKFSYRGVVV